MNIFQGGVIFVPTQCDQACIWYSFNQIGHTISFYLHMYGTHGSWSFVNLIPNQCDQTY